MPPSLRVRPALDDGVGAWRVWWRARRAWREVHDPGAAFVGWMEDVRSLHLERRRRWAADVRAARDVGGVR